MYVAILLFTKKIERTLSTSLLLTVHEFKMQYNGRFNDIARISIYQPMINATIKTARFRHATNLLRSSDLAIEVGEDVGTSLLICSKGVWLGSWVGRFCVST